MDNKLIPLGNTSIVLTKTSSALAITNKLTFNQNRKLVKEIFLKNPQFFINYISCFYPLSDELLEKYKSYWNWEFLSKNIYLSWSEDLITEYSDKWDWKNLSILLIIKEITFTNKLIDKYKDRWDWLFLSLNWSSEKFLYEHKDKWNWDVLSNNNKLPWSDQLIKKYKNKWDWNELSKNQFLPWSETLIRS